MALNTIPTSGLWSAIAGFLNDNFSEITSANQVSGTYNYVDATTSGTPITPVVDTWTILTNDGAGTGTETSYGLVGLANIWNTVTDRLDFTGLTLGDSLDFRMDLNVTTTVPNQEVLIDAFVGEGGVENQIPLHNPTQYKSAGVHRVALYSGGSVLSANTKDNPASLRIKTDASASIEVLSWYIRVVRRGI